MVFEGLFFEGSGYFCFPSFFPTNIWENIETGILMLVYDDSNHNYDKKMGPERITGHKSEITVFRSDSCCNQNLRDIQDIMRENAVKVIALRFIVQEGWVFDIVPNG